MARRTSEHKIILSAEDRTKLAGRQAQQTINKLNRELASTKSKMRSAFDPRIIANFAGAIGLVSTTRQITQLGDAYTKVNEKVNLGNKTLNEATATESKLGKVRKDLLKLSNDTFSSLDANASAYQKVSFAVVRLGKDSTETLKILELVNKSLQIGGATETEARSTNLQFSQALASDRLGGDEFRSILENAPRLVKAIADGLDVSLGKLKDMAKASELTSDVVIGAISSQANKLDKEFSSLNLTIDRAQQIWTNNLTEFIGQANEGIGINRVLADTIRLASENIDVMAIALGALAAVFAGRLVGSVGKYVAAQALATTATERQALATKRAIALELASAKARQAHSAMLLREAQASTAATIGLARLTKVTKTLIPAQNELTLATNAVTASQARYALATRSASIASGAGALAVRGLSGALSLIGGPVGASVIAGAGVLYFGNELLNTAEKLNTLGNQEQTHHKILEKTKRLTNEAKLATEQRTKAIRESLDVQLAQAKSLSVELNIKEANTASDLQENPLSVNKYGFANDLDGISRVNRAKTAQKEAKRQRELVEKLEAEEKKLAKTLEEKNIQLAKSNSLLDEGNAGEARARALQVKKLDAEKAEREELIKKGKALEKALHPQIAYREEIKLLDDIKKTGGFDEEGSYEKAKANALKKLTDATKKTTKATKEKVDQDQKEADSLLASASPLDDYNQKIARANELKAKGKLVGEDYEKVINNHKKAYEEATKEKKKAITEEERLLKQLKEEAVNLNKLNDPQLAYSERLKELNKLNETGSLTEKAFNAERKKAKKLYEESNLFLQEQNRLLAEKAAIGDNPIDTYRKELEKTGDYSSDEVDSLVSDAQLKAYEKVKAEIIAQGKESGLTEEAYTRLRLSLEGLTDKQVDFLTGLIKTNEKIIEGREANESFAQGLEQDISNALENGELSFKNFGDAIIAEIMRMYAYKPLLDALFGQKNKDGGRVGGIATDFLDNFFANGGVMSSKGPLPLNMYANGGIANKPQVAVFGEGRMNEAYVPLPDGRTIPVTLNEKEVSSVQINHGPINIVHKNIAGQETKLENQSQDENGEITLEFVAEYVESRQIEKSRKGGGLAKLFAKRQA